MAGDAKFAVDEAIAGPFQDGFTEADLAAFPWPKASDFDFSSIAAAAETQPARVRIGGFWTGIFGDSYRMAGFQQFLFNLAAEPELTKALVDRVTEMYLELNDAVFTTLKGKLDVWFFGNDFGSQDGLLFSADMWADFFFENIRRLAALAHGHGLKVMMHSCGAIRPLIPRLIEAGVDILDPIQVTARGMTPAELRAEFGGRIVFHGGVDTQRALPFKTPAEVAAHARETAAALGGANGGYIFSSSQLLGPDIPVDNVLAMYAAGAGAPVADGGGGE